jgi:hypothetical protein
MAKRTRVTTEEPNGESSTAGFVFGAPGKKIKDRAKKQMLDARRLIQDAYTSWGESVYPDEARTVLRMRSPQAVAHAISALEMARSKLDSAITGAREFYEAQGGVKE